MELPCPPVCPCPIDGVTRTGVTAGEELPTTAPEEDKAELPWPLMCSAGEVVCAVVGADASAREEELSVITAETDSIDVAA